MTSEIKRNELMWATSAKCEDATDQELANMAGWPDKDPLFVSVQLSFSFRSRHSVQSCQIQSLTICNDGISHSA